MKVLSVIACAVVALSCICLPSCKKEQKQGSRYEINAEYREDAQSVSGTVKVVFVNSRDTELEQLKFNLYPNAYRKNALYPAVGEGEREAAYYDGESYGEITVTSVNGAKSWTVEGEDENILTVELVSPLSKKQSVTLDLSFVTELARVEHRLGVGKRAVNLANFYPRLCAYADGEFLEDESNSFGNPFRADCADYLVRLTVPCEYAVLGGVKEVVKGLESKTKYEFEAQNARDFACVLAKNMRTVSAKTTLSGGREISLEYAFHDSQSSEEVLQTAKQATEYFSKTFGAYPYPTLTVVRVGGVLKSSVHTSLICLAENLSEKELLQTLVSAIARQWWGVAVGSDEESEAWQSEAFCKYSALCFFESYPDYGVARSALVGQSTESYRGYFSVYGSVFGGVDTRMSRNLKDFANAYEYERLTSDKGVIMLDTLRKSVGDKRFFESWKSYYESNRFEFVKPIAVYEAFSKNGVDSTGFFQSFLQGKAVI